MEEEVHMQCTTCDVGPSSGASGNNSSGASGNTMLPLPRNVLCV